MNRGSGHVFKSGETVVADSVTERRERFERLEDAKERKFGESPSDQATNEQAENGGEKGRTSVNQLNMQIGKGQAPKGVTRVDRAKVTGERIHVHFADVSACRRDLEARWGRIITRNTRLANQ